ncbi:MAG: Gfo/Idh/MocA family protein [Brevundimonas sp.]
MRASVETQPRVAAPDGPPRTLIVGAGLMGRWHMAAARRAGAHVVGVVDQDMDAARALARSAPDAATVGDLSLIPQGLHIDAAHVCTPMTSHAEITTVLLERGAHVFVEKPMAADAVAVRRLTEAADARALYVCPVHQYAFQPGVDLARTKVSAAGARRIDFTLCSAGAVGRFEGRADAVAAEILPHPLSILQRLLPEADIGAVDWSVRRAQAGEFSIMGQVGATLVTIAISLSARPTCFLTRVHTDQGLIEIDGFHGHGVVLGGRVSRAAKVLAPFERGTRGLAEATAALTGRLLRQDLAYPGLRTLTRRFYKALPDPARRPISLDEALACAVAGDAILAGMRRAGAELPYV